MNHQVIADEPISIEPNEAAAMLLSWLEAHGAIVGLNSVEQLRIDLNPMRDMNHEKAERVSRLIFSVRDELRALLIARKGVTVH